ncbi:MAG TPA: cupin domain-containing protein [Vicinamibacterales bacterium]|nr:cupin domain-containing protein [Vicinamibacterales bacterium]
MKPAGIVGIAMIAVGVQDPLHFPPADRISVRVMSELSPIDVAPGVHVRTLVGPTGSVSIGEFEPGSAAVLHHHTREQADVGLTGTFDMTIGTHVEKLGPDMGVIVPSNVAHSIANKTAGEMTVLEFHTVPRPDLVPPRPAMTFPSSPEAVPVPDSPMIVKLDLPRTETAQGITGKTCTMTWHRLGQGAKPADVQAQGTELLVYVIRGSLQIDGTNPPQTAKAGSVIMVPAHQHARLQALDTEVMLVDFSPARR